MRKLITLTSMLALLAGGAYAQIDKKATDARRTNIRLVDAEPRVHPLIVLDDKLMVNQDLKKMNLDPNNLASIQILKDSASVAKYGKAGKNGVLIITSKNYSPNQTDSTAKHPLYLVDGAEIAHDGLNLIAPDSIEYIQVLKDKNATDDYGYRGANGVVLVALKKSE